MSAVYLFRLDNIIENKVRGSLRSQTSDRRFLNEKYLPIQILRNSIVTLKGEGAFPREKLYNDKSWTVKLAEETIGNYKLFDYNYPDCRIQFDLLDKNLLRSLIPGSIWDVEVIYFDSNHFYEEKHDLWHENTLKTDFDYFIDPTYFPDLNIEIGFRERIGEQFVGSIEEFFKDIALDLGVYASKPFHEQENVCILLDFQKKEYSKEMLDKILKDLNNSNLSASIRTIRVR